LKCAVNLLAEAQLIVWCSVPNDIERFDRENLTFKFDDSLVRFYKIASVSVAADEDHVVTHPDIKAYPTFTEGNLVVGYPQGFSDVSEDTVKHMNPYLPESTIGTLEVSIGEKQALLKVNVKHMNFPGSFMYALHAIPFSGLFKFAVDQDGSMYVKFDHPEDADYMAIMHFFFARTMIKFYKLNSLNNMSKYIDKSEISPIYWRRCISDQWNQIQA
jgi:hypothetical protein